MDERELTEAVRRTAAEYELDLVGVADLEPAMRKRPEVFAAVGRPFPRAVVMGLRLSRAVLATCVDGPSALYFHHYRQANNQLDRAALAVAIRLQRAGHDALPIGASQVIGEGVMRGHVSHRAVAELAGLGWRGRSGLLVTPGFGAQVRLVTVLTDAPLVPDAPITGTCGACRRCRTVCPAHAIGETAADFHLQTCLAQLSEFRKRPFIGQHICGLCVRACDGTRPPAKPGGGMAAQE
jgi:epoxyqueuosine reductase